MNARTPLIWFMGTLLLAGCAGPRPVVERQELQAPTTAGGPYHLLVTVRNRGGGEGQTEVVARLRDSGTNETAAQADQEVDLRRHESVTVSLELRPSGPGPYTPECEAKYPPQ